MKIKILFPILIGLLLVGCAGSTTNRNYQTALQGLPVIKGDVNVSKAEQQLADSAASINGALLELAAIQKAVYPAARLPDLPDANRIGMGKKASVDWTGPIEPLVRNIAQVCNYKVRVIGKNPAIPIIVAVSVQNTVIAAILRNAAYQCGSRANIVVYPNSRVIELRYARV